MVTRLEDDDVTGGSSASADAARGYRDVVDGLLARIEAQLKAGHRLPSERRLADEYGVNRHTVRHALRELEALGIIATLRGSGSIVVNRRISHRIAIHTSISASAASAGLSLATELVAVGPEVSEEDAAVCAASFGRKATGAATTVRSLDGAPVLWQRHLFGGLDVAEALAGYAGGSLHDYFRRHHGIAFRRLDSRVRAGLPTPEDVRRLLVPRALPVLVSHSLNVTDREEVWEVSLTTFRSDAFELSIGPP